MDLGLSEEQELLKNTARDFLEKECPETLVREMEEDEKGYSPDLWKKMAEQGWQGLLIPDQYGGADFSYLDLIVLVEEFGRALVPGPFISTVVGGTLPLLEGGTEDQKKQYLPQIASGNAIWTLAFTEPSARFDAEGVVAYLESSNPRNIPLYERHGFEVMGKIQVGAAPVLTPMLRRPRTR